ncbi:Cellulose synthase catalytic subunit [UDP-forming] [Roseibaca ekhonensis]|uniref:Cellulose synthase catalytic subunit [UDP-forming] n=1 Tax=Roseinatronobacter ekhonensis TaxID=254356 RepID=A0A3B0MB29_9RHOB|nr:UDP-forming cellulose synthase catalytic subunit [Roseibaca ekhonensis]SUZ33071.1 Cellulose synthase catalytic subunit [UDP-forming] [Roseibaca ekhonensis]
MSLLIANRRLKPGEVVLALLWFAIVIPLAFLASIPTSNAVQGGLGLFAVVCVALLKPWTMKTIVARFALLAIASSIVMRYWFWRITSTLPPMDEPLSFAIAVALFAVETYAICVFFVSSFITADPIERKLPPKVAASSLPTVDILVPSYNEPIEMLSVTLSAAKNMHYPPHKRTVVLCDDGGTDERCNSDDSIKAHAARKRRADLQALCAELGIVYSTRAENINAKAGNMSAAMERLNGDLVVVFDADHVPARDFLARTVGYFVVDPNLFLVQTPHFFLNPDPVDRNIGLRADCPPENEMFYHQGHRGLDRWGGAFFCGSASVLRRAALDSVGGFAGETITEDAETALEIHSQGWKSLYVDHAMIAGLQPETFTSFIEQRGRWATGMMQLLRLKNPLRRKGMSLSQRLCYLNSMTFWLFPLVRMTFILAPLAYLFFELQIFVATIEEVAVYMSSYMAISFMVQNGLYARTRWPLISELYETAQAPYLSGVVLRTIFKPRGAKFNVTAKDEVLEEDFLSPIHRPLLILWGIALLGVVAAAVRWFMFPGDHNILMIVGGWAIFNFVILSAALGAIGERRQRRAVPRVDMVVPAVAAVGQGEYYTFTAATVLDSSTSGAKLKLTPGPDTDIAELTRLEKGSVFYFTPEFPKSPHLENAVRVQVVNISRDPSGLVLGVRYDPDQPLIVRETIAHLIFGDSAVWERVRESRNKPMPLLKGMGYVLMLAFSSVAHVMRMIANEPARRKRAEERERDTAIVDDQPAHILAFGEAFDPVLHEPVHPMKQMLTQSGRAAEEYASRTTRGAELDRRPRT